MAFKDKSGITAVDFNVGKSDRSGIKVTGKRKKVQMQYIYMLIEEIILLWILFSLLSF